jgi:hypothetical protein
MKEFCHNCKFYVRYDRQKDENTWEETGTCHRYPPVLVLPNEAPEIIYEETFSWSQPNVTARLRFKKKGKWVICGEDWCGEHKEN